MDAFERTIRINLVGPFNVIRLAAAAMAAGEPTGSGERGVIVNTASVAAFDGQIGQAASGWTARCGWPRSSRAGQYRMPASQVRGGFANVE